MTRLLTSRSPVSSRVKPRGQSAARTLQVADHPQGTQLGEEPPATGPAPCPRLPACFVPGPAPYPRPRRRALRQAPPPVPAPRRALRQAPPPPACFAPGANPRTRYGEAAEVSVRAWVVGAGSQRPIPPPGSLQVAGGSPGRSLGARGGSRRKSLSCRGVRADGAARAQVPASGPGQDPSFPSCFLIGV